jgi:predicted amidohydrolase
MQAPGGEHQPVLRLGVAQLAPQPCDVSGNAALIAAAVLAAGADLLVTPELSLTGYDIGDAVRRLAGPAHPGAPAHAALPRTAACDVVIGTVEADTGGPFNAGIVVRGGEHGSFGSADIWDRMVRTTAQLCGIYVVLVNRVGVEGGVTFAGGSVVAAPDGEVLARPAGRSCCCAAGCRWRSCCRWATFGRASCRPWPKAGAGRRGSSGWRPRRAGWRRWTGR